jgi:hypothetical protein
MGEGDGVYYSDSAYSGEDVFSGGDAGSGGVAPSRARSRSKKAAVAFVGLSAVGAGAYFATTLFAAHPLTTLNREPRALAPVAPMESSVPVTRSTLGAPAPGPIAGTKSAARQSLRPSPTPSPSAMADEEVASLQVSRLLQALPAPSGPGMAAASVPVTVTNRSGTDGSAIRVVSARYDLTGRSELLAAADRGQVVGGARCTRNLRVGAAATPEVRPTMLLCWRTAADKSVVTVAINKVHAPSAGVSAAVVDQEWIAMG